MKSHAEAPANTTIRFNQDMEDRTPRILNALERAEDRSRALRCQEMTSQENERRYETSERRSESHGKNIEGSGSQTGRTTPSKARRAASTRLPARNAELDVDQEIRTALDARVTDRGRKTLVQRSRDRGPEKPDQRSRRKVQASRYGGAGRCRPSIPRLERLSSEQCPGCTERVSQWLHSPEPAEVDETVGRLTQRSGQESRPGVTTVSCQYAVSALCLASIIFEPGGAAGEQWASSAPFRDLHLVDGITTSNDEHSISLYWHPARLRIEYADGRGPFERNPVDVGELYTAVSVFCRADGRAHGLSGPRPLGARLALPMHPDAPDV